MTVDRLAALSDVGVSIWLDDLDRHRLTSGGLAALAADRHVVGVTTNPTIFDLAISHGAAEYAAQVRDLAVRAVSVEEAVRALTAYDVRRACDVLRPVYDRTDGLDGRVSLEVDPRLARDTAATIAEARALWWLVDRPNALIKIPATVEGLPAITAALAEGICVNVTLIFGVERYRGVIEAYLAGLEQARANGHDVSRLVSVASFFVSRVDTEVDRRLDLLGTPEAAALRGRAAIANARLAWEVFGQSLRTDRWAALAAAGARPQRPLWASTSTKDPAFSDTRYVTELTARGCVNTMPEQTLDAVADHGDIRPDTILADPDGTTGLWPTLAALGIDETDVVTVLEDEGVRKFADSWNQLLGTLRTALAAARAEAGR